MITNNNHRILWDLAIIFYRKHRKRNLLLVIAVAISVVLIYSGFAISYSKIQTDFLIEARKAETVATVKIDQGSKKQVKQLKQLSYINKVGIEKDLFEIKQAELSIGQLTYQDQSTFTNFTRPAISELVGDYPQTAQEIMVPRRFLQQINKSDSQVGDKLSLTLLSEGQTEFVISGIYTSYSDPSVDLSKIFVSKDFLIQKKIALYPVTNILIMQANSLEGEFIENRLYEDLPMKSSNQQIIGQTSYYKQAIDQTFGSYWMALVIASLVFLAVFLFIFNILSISLENDTREIGLLKTLGTTNQQLNHILLYQILFNGLLGSLVGMVVVTIVSKTILPKIVERLYLNGMGSFPKNATNSLLFLLISIFFSLLSLSLSMLQANQKVKKLTPKSAVNYATVATKKSKLSNIHFTSIPIALAWRRVMSSKKRLVITIGSLVIGILVGLSALIIINGTNIINDIKENEDFGIVNLLSPDDLSDPATMSDSLFIPQRTVKTINQLREIDPHKTKTVNGNYVKVDLAQDPGLRPRYLANKQADHHSDFATLQVLDNDSIDKLIEYIQGINYPADVSSFKNGEGVLLLHHHKLSKILETQAIQTIGTPISLYALSTQTFETIDQIGEVINAGYLDITKQAFPDLDLGLNGTTINYLVISEKGFKRLGLSQQTMMMKLWGKPNDQQKLKKELTDIVYQANHEIGETEPLFMASNDEVLQAETKNNETTQLILMGFSVVLLLIGLISFINTIQMNYQETKTELALLQTLGMTRSQQRQLNLAEGLIYWCIFGITLLTLAVPIFYEIEKIMKSRIAYFKYEFPIYPLLGTILIMLFLCIGIVQLNYRQKK